jgi:hypothetical protein
MDQTILFSLRMTADVGHSNSRMRNCELCECVWYSYYYLLVLQYNRPLVINFFYFYLFQRGYQFLVTLRMSPPTNDTSTFVGTDLNIIRRGLVSNVRKGTHTGNTANENDGVGTDITQPDWLVIDGINSLLRVHPTGSDTAGAGNEKEQRKKNDMRERERETGWLDDTATVYIPLRVLLFFRSREKKDPPQRIFTTTTSLWTKPPRMATATTPRKQVISSIRQLTPSSWTTTTTYRGMVEEVARAKAFMMSVFDGKEQRYLKDARNRLGQKQ